MQDTIYEDKAQLSSSSQNHQHFKMFKPYGCASQFKPRTRKNKKLLDVFYYEKNIMFNPMYICSLSGNTIVFKSNFISNYI